MAKKKILSIILAAAIAVAGMATLTSCSKGDDKKAETTAQEEKAETDAEEEEGNDEPSEEELTNAGIVSNPDEIDFGYTTIKELDENCWGWSGYNADEIPDEEFFLICLSYEGDDDSDDMDEMYYVEIEKGDSSFFGDYVINSIEPAGDSFDFDGTEIEVGATVQDMIDAGLTFDGARDVLSEGITTASTIIANEKTYAIVIKGGGEEDKENPITEATFEYVGYAW